MTHTTTPRSTIAIPLALLLTLLTACVPSGNLQPDDFDIYLNGKVVINIHEEGSFDIDTYAEEPYTTKRGIKVGSSLIDVARAYTVQSLPNIMNDDIETTNIIEKHAVDQTLRDYLNEHPEFQNGTVSFRLYIVNGTPVYDQAKITDILENVTQYEVQYYYLIMLIEDGLVQYINLKSEILDEPL